MNDTDDAYVYEDDQIDDTDDEDDNIDADTPTRERRAVAFVVIAAAVIRRHFTPNTPIDPND